MMAEARTGKRTLIQTRVTRKVADWVRKKAASEGRSVSSWLWYLLVRQQNGEVEQLKHATDVAIARTVDLTLIRTDLLDVLVACGLKPKGIMTFAEDLRAVKSYVEELQAHIRNIEGPPQ